MDNNKVIKVYTTSNGAELNISAPSTKQLISATNNRAQYFAEQAQKFRDEAKIHRDNAKFYAEQNSNVTFEQINNLKYALEEKIATKQDIGNYALKEELPINVSELQNDSQYVIKSELDTAVQSLELPSQEGCDGRFLMSNGEEEAWVGINTFQMFDIKLTDKILSYEEEKGWALQGTYVYKEAIAGSRYGYPDFYNKCLEERDEAIANGGVQMVTLGGTSMSMYIHPNGHMYYDISMKATVDNWFNTFGTAWFYGVDIENKRIFLPRNNWFEQASTTDVGQSVEAGLPNITGTFSYLKNDNNGNIGGSLYFQGTSSVNTAAASGSGKTIIFDASRSSSIYGNSNTVQPNAVKKLLYICVGNQVQDLSTIDIVTQVDNGVKEIDDAYQSAMTSLQAVGPVLQTGSTMTGDLTINKPTNSWPTINFVSKGTMGETSDTVQYGARLISRDTRNQYFATYEHAIAENGRARAYMVARSTNDDGATYSNHRLEVTCNPDGSGGTYIDGKFVKAFVTQTYVNGDSWYRVYSDGWCEQGGLSPKGVAGERTISLLKNFANTNYFAIYNALDAVATYIAVYDKTVSTFKIKVFTSSGNRNYDCQWTACGYIS